MAQQQGLVDDNESDWLVGYSFAAFRASVLGLYATIFDVNVVIFVACASGGWVGVADVALGEVLFGHKKHSS